MKFSVVASLSLALAMGCASNPPPPPAPPPTITPQPEPAPEPPPPAPEPPPAAPSEATLHDNHIELAHQILFDLNSDHIDEEHSQGVLRDLVALLQANPRIRRLRIEGHTDTQGSASRNLDLSNRRAAAVATYLRTHGIPNVTYETQGLGQTQPLCRENNDACHDRNRRVEFTVLEMAPQ